MRPVRFLCIVVLLSLWLPSAARAEETAGPASTASGWEPEPALIGLGAGVFGVGYGLQVLALRPKPSEGLSYVPIVAPPVASIRFCSDVWGDHGDFAVFAKTACILGIGAAVLDSAIQAGGLTALVVGIVGLEKPEKKKRSVSVLPIATPTGAGVGLGGTF